MKKKYLFKGIIPIGFLGIFTSSGIFAAPLHLSAATNLRIIIQNEISGKVVDAQGNPIPSVTISSSDGKSTSTSVSGEFKILAKVGDVLTLKSVGFQTQQYTIRNASANIIQLVEDVGNLEEVVIVGYGRQRKGNLTGAISSVNADQLKN